MERSPSTQDALDRALDDFAAGRALDDLGRRLLLRAARGFAAMPSRHRAAVLHQEGLRARDRFIVELAEKHCGGLKAVKPKADKIAGWARRYEGVGWKRDKHATSCSSPSSAAVAADKFTTRRLSESIRTQHPVRGSRRPRFRFQGLSSDKLATSWASPPTSASEGPSPRPDAPATRSRASRSGSGRPRGQWGSSLAHLPCMGP